MKKSLLAICAFILVAVTAETARACHALPLLNPQAVPVPGGLQVTADSDAATCGCGEYWLDVEVVCVNQPFTAAGFPSTGVYPALNGPVFYNSAQWLKPNCTQQAHPWVTINFASLCPGTTYKYRMREHHATGIPPAGTWSSTFTFTTPGAPPNFTLNVAAANSAICIPQNTTLTASVTGGCAGVSYAWTPAATLSCTTCANPIASPTVTTTYSVTVTDSCSGVALTSSVQVYVGNPPAAGVANVSPSNICSGSTTTLTLTGAAGNIQWQESLDNIVFTNISGATSSTFTTSPLTDTMYYQALVTDPGCGSSNSNSVAVFINPNPVVSAGSPAAICIGNNTTLSASGANTYSWSPSTGLTNPNISNPTASPSATTTYTVTGTDANGCTDTDQVTITVNAASVTASSGVTVCNGAFANISAAGTNAVSYSWSPSASLNNAAVSNPVATPSVTTTYTVTLTDINGCLATDSVTVTINQLPSASAGQDAAVCAGSGVLLSGSGGTSYAWSPATGLNSTTNSSPFANPATTTTYTVTVTGSNGCVGIDSVVITVNPPPAANAGPNTTFCTGSAGAQLNATGGVTYSWSPSAGLSNPNIANPLVTTPPSNPTNYTVTVTDANGCTSQDVVQVTIAPPPTVTASNDVTLCNGGSTSLTASGALTYTWSPSTGLNNPNIPNPSVTGLSGSQTYTVTGTDANGCTDTDVVTVNISVSPQMSNITPTPATCGDNNGTIDVGTTTGGNAPLTYSIGSQTSSTGDFSNLAPGFYTITVTDASGCSSQQTTNVASVLGVNASLTASATSGAMPFEVTFTNATTGANNFVWNFGDASAPVMSTSAGTMMHTFTAPGTYTVTLTAWNNDPACSQTVTVVITVEEEMSLSVPNVFTPNGDNVNDLFKVIDPKGVKEINAVVYNRWGRKVAEWSGDQNSGWNGQIDGGTAQEGVYYYVLNATGTNGKTTVFNGFVEVIKSK